MAGQAFEHHHTAYLTTDMDAAILRWQHLLSAEVELPRTHIAADDVDVCFLSLPGIRIELVQPRDAELAARRTREAKGRPDHVCFRCPNVDARVAAAAGEGGVVVRPPVYSEAFGTRMCFILYSSLGLVEWAEK
jgi:hypothetical protein